MTGSIKQRGKTWSFVVDLAPDASGKRRQIRRHGFRTKRDAADAMAKIRTDANSGTFTPRSTETLGGWLGVWLQGRRASLKATTWASYDQITRTHIVPSLGHVRLQDVTAEMLDAFYAQKLTSGRLTGKRKGGPLSKRTVNYMHVIIASALKDAVRKRKVPTNVALDADAPSQPKVNASGVWTAEQLRAFLNHVRNDNLYPLWLLAASTGMRRGELAGVRWRDLDIPGARMMVTQAVVIIRDTEAGADGRRHQHLEFSTPKSDRGARTFPLDAATVEAFKAHRLRYAEARLARGADFNDNDLIFPLADGSPINPEKITDLFQDAAKDAGLPVITLHQVRHTYASIALAVGVNPRVVADRLGHSDVKVTLGVYSHVLPGVHEEAAEKVSALIMGTGS